MLGNAIGDLPPVEGGWRPEAGADGWKEYAGPQTSFQRRMRRDMDGEMANRVYDQITRPVRDDDKMAFEDTLDGVKKLSREELEGDDK